MTHEKKIGQLEFVNLANKEPCHQNDNQLHALHTHNKEPCLPK
jgi:hypothetical protein